jgi:hypothetical protein
LEWAVRNPVLFRDLIGAERIDQYFFSPICLGPLTCYILTALARDRRYPNPILEDIANILTWVLRCTPSFCLGKGLFHAINIDTFLFLEDDDSLSVWSEPILLYEVYFLSGQCAVFLLLAIQLDKWSTNPRVTSLWRWFVACITMKWLVAWKKKHYGCDSTTALLDDDDVRKEQERVLSGRPSTDLIVIKKLTKIYDDGKVAVDNLSLGIAPGECFGLLGINGKTLYASFWNFWALDSFFNM